MTDPEKTDTNWKARAATAWDWARAHKDITIPVATFLFGMALGAWFAS